MVLIDGRLILLIWSRYGTHFSLSIKKQMQNQPKKHDDIKLFCLKMWVSRRHILRLHISTFKMKRKMLEEIINERRLRSVRSDHTLANLPLSAERGRATWQEVDKNLTDTRGRCQPGKYLTNTRSKQISTGEWTEGQRVMVYGVLVYSVSCIWLGDPILSDVLEKPKWLLVKAIFPCWLEKYQQYHTFCFFAWPGIF